MRIGDLARTAGVGVETVRFYQRRRLLRTPLRPDRGTRAYSPTDLARLRFIRRAQQLGFSLDEIVVLLELSERDCANVQVVARRKLAAVREKITDLTRLAGALQDVVSRCERRKPRDSCPIIQTLSNASDDRT